MELFGVACLRSQMSMINTSLCIRSMDTDNSRPLGCMAACVKQVESLHETRASHGVVEAAIRSLDASHGTGDARVRNIWLTRGDALIIDIYKRSKAMPDSSTQHHWQPSSASGNADILNMARERCPERHRLLPVAAQTILCLTLFYGSVNSSRLFQITSDVERNHKYYETCRGRKAGGTLKRLSLLPFVDLSKRFSVRSRSPFTRANASRKEQVDAAVDISCTENAGPCFGSAHMFHSTFVSPTCLFSDIAGLSSSCAWY
jgi:hypothetical protein